MEAKEKVVAFLGPKASYTHQVSNLSHVSYSARQARYNALAREALKQVSKRWVDTMNVTHELPQYANKHQRPQRSSFQNRSTRSFRKRALKMCLLQYRPPRRHTALYRSKILLTAPLSLRSTSLLTCKGGIPTYSSVAKSIYLFIIACSEMFRKNSTHRRPTHRGES